MQTNLYCGKMQNTPPLMFSGKNSYSGLSIMTLKKVMKIGQLH